MPAESSLSIARRRIADAIERETHSLDLSELHLGDPGILEIWSDIVRVSGWRSLRLRSMGLGPEAGREISRTIRAGQFRALSNLDLGGGNSFGARAELELVRSIAAGGLPSLTSLVLDNNNLHPDAVLELARAIAAERVESLTSLCLARNLLGPEVGSVLVCAIEAGRLASLTSLDLASTQIGGEAGLDLARALAAGRLPSLTTLKLGSMYLGPKAGLELARALDAGQLPELSNLDLSENHLGPEAGLELARAVATGRLPSLTQLVVSNNDFGPEAGMVLARAITAGRLATLIDLNLRGNSIGVSDDALHGLGPAQQARLIIDSRAGRLDLTIKVAILGEPAAGKSALRRRLSGQPPPARETRVVEETHSFTWDSLWLASELPPPQRAISQRLYQSADEEHSGERPDLSDLVERPEGVCLRLFDFGGQQALQSAHRFFLAHQRSMYCIVADASRTLADSRLEYWLRYVAATHEERLRWSARFDVGREAEAAPAAWPDEERARRVADRMAAFASTRSRAVCVVVLSHCAREDLSTRMPSGDRRTLERSIAVEQVLELTAQPEFDGLDLEIVDGFDSYDDPADKRLATVRVALGKAAAKVTEIWTNKLPMAFFDARGRIAEQFGDAADEEQAAHELVPWLPLRDVRSEIVKSIMEHGGTLAHAQEDAEAVYLRTLRDLGVVHWVGDMPSHVLPEASEIRELVLNPRWVRGPVYRVLRMRSDGAGSGLSRGMILRELEGRGERHGARDMSPGITREQAAQVFRLMEACDLIVPLTMPMARDGGDERYLVIDQLTDEPGASLDDCDVRWRLDFMPDWFMPRLIGRLWPLRPVGGTAFRNMFRVQLPTGQSVSPTLCFARIVADSRRAQIGVTFEAGTPDERQRLQGRIEEHISDLYGRPVYALAKTPDDTTRADRVPGPLTTLSRRQLELLREWRTAVKPLQGALTDHEFGERIAAFEAFLSNVDRSLSGSPIQRTAVVAFEVFRLFSQSGQVLNQDSGRAAGHACVLWLFQQAVHVPGERPREPSPIVTAFTSISSRDIVGESPGIKLLRMCERADRMWDGLKEIVGLGERGPVRRGGRDALDQFRDGVHLGYKALGVWR